MSTEVTFFLALVVFSIGALGIAFYIGYRLKGAADEVGRLVANENARKEADANLQGLKDLSKPKLDERGTPWLRDKF